MLRKFDKRNLVFPLYLYWLVLIICQNIGEYTARTSMDMIIKGALICFLTFSFVRKNFHFSGISLFIWCCFAGFSKIAMDMWVTSPTMTQYIYYYFPSLFALLTLVGRADAEIDKKHFMVFLKLVIATVLYMCIYSFLFLPEKFSGILSLKSAYGNELASFLLSNHEFAMYIVFALTATIVCYQDTKKSSSKFMYLFVALILTINLIATFSRTAMIACIAIITVFILMASKAKIKKWFIFAMIAGVVAFITVPQLQEFVQNIVLKGNTGAGRFEMWEALLQKFADADFKTQCFGHGYNQIVRYLNRTFEHSSAHNMFIHTLLVWGIVGLIFLVSLVIYGLKNALSIYNNNSYLSTVFFALVISSVAFMFTNTACLMQSPIDSYMMTVFTLIVPKYVCNSIRNGTFEQISTGENIKNEKK